MNPSGRVRAAVVAGLAAAALAAGALSSASVRPYLKRSPITKALNGPLLRRADLFIRRLRVDSPTPAELGDGRLATEIRLGGPAGVAIGPTGDIYLSDRGYEGVGSVVWRIDGDGVAHVIAGTGERGLAQPGVDATRSALGSPQGIAVDSLGRVYIADSYNHVVVRVEPDGTLSWVAGTGRLGASGDGGPATAARLDQPYDVAIGPDGSLYIADFGNHRIRRVRPDGIIETVAGTGEPGYSGDGGPARAARLHGPYGVAFDRRIGLLIGDTENHAIRQVDADGRIHTIAGGHGLGYDGDDGPATAARFNAPQGVAVDALGRIWIGDEHNHVVRVIDTSGVIRTVAGTGVAGDGAATGDPRQVPLNDPEGIAPRRDGTVLVAEGGGGRVRLIVGDTLIRTVIGSARTARADP